MLSALYYGDICPMEDAVPNAPEDRELKVKAAEDLEELQSCLTEEQMALVNRLQMHTNEMNCYKCEAKFRFGLCMGIQLMGEANAVNIAHGD